MVRKITMMMAVLMTMLSVAAFADQGQHNKAMIRGTMHKSQDDKGYVVHVDSAKTEDGKDIPELKGTDVALPEMDETCKKHCEENLGKSCTVVCDIKDGKVTKVHKVTSDTNKPKGGDAAN